MLFLEHESESESQEEILAALRAHAKTIYT